jgi:hypothetical protein
MSEPIVGVTKIAVVRVARLIYGRTLCTMQMISKAASTSSKPLNSIDFGAAERAHEQTNEEQKRENDRNETK